MFWPDHCKSAGSGSDDNIHEESETFNLIIAGSLLPNVVTSRDNATVIIMDNDSK